MLVGIPLRGFALSKSRLDENLGPTLREQLARAVAGRVVEAARGGGLDVVVVTAATDVMDWCRRAGIPVIEDAGSGLDGAATQIVATADTTPWAVVHGDLPLVAPADIARAAALVERGSTVLAPSRDGGTNLLAGHGAFPFRYGLASFSHHLARAAGRMPLVLVTPGLAVEIDTPTDLAAVLATPGGSWLVPFLS